MTNPLRALFLLVSILVLVPGAARAVKPQAPVTVNCETIGHKEFVYTAECRVEVNGEHIPDYVRMSAVQDKGTLIAKYKPENANGMGKWIIVFEARGQKPLPVLFDVHYPDGTVIRATGLYDPYGVMAKQKNATPLGVVKEKQDGGGVREYPSD